MLTRHVPSDEQHRENNEADGDWFEIAVWRKDSLNSIPCNATEATEQNLGQQYTITGLTDQLFKKLKQYNRAYKNIMMVWLLGLASKLYITLNLFLHKNVD